MKKSFLRNNYFFETLIIGHLWHFFIQFGYLYFTVYNVNTNFAVVHRIGE